MNYSMLLLPFGGGFFFFVLEKHTDIICLDYHWLQTNAVPLISFILAHIRKSRLYVCKKGLALAVFK